VVKGEYHLANNTQDDLATIAGKISYRTDDHGNTPGTATALVVTGNQHRLHHAGNDPANTNTANKGVLERTRIWMYFRSSPAPVPSASR
jgi:hypothetical protein